MSSWALDPFMMMSLFMVELFYSEAHFNITTASPQILAKPLSGLDESLNLYEPLFPHCKFG